MTPTREHVEGFLQGYMQARLDAYNAAVEAKEARRNIVEHLADELAIRYTNWQLRAERAYRSEPKPEPMPKIDQVVGACVLAAVMLGMFLVFLARVEVGV
jgi:hypothetical protein